MSITKLTCHIVFATKHRQPTISKLHKRELFAYIFGIINNLNCTLIRINGMSDHIHLLVDLRPSLSISDFVKTIKQSSTNWLRNNPDFPMFDKWQEGFFASVVSYDGIESCKKYIMSQESHHAIYPFFTEMEKLVLANGLEWDPKKWE